MSEALRRPIRRNPRMGHAVGRTARCFTRRTYGLVVERHRAAEHLARRLHEAGAAPPAEAGSVLRLTMRATVFASGLAYGSVTKI